VRLAAEIDWDFLAKRFSSVCRIGPGQPPLPTRLVAGLFILKHMHNLSDEALCDRWVENPYFQYFCGEVVFRHELPFNRSSLTRWRQRLGEEQMAALLQESLSVAHRSGAIETKELERVVVDTTVQEKAIAHPTDARLSHRAIEKLVDLAKRQGVELRQSYLRLAKRGQFVLHAKALHGNPYDGHTLGPVIADLESSQVSRCAASTATRGIAATIIRSVQGLDQRPGPPGHPSHPPRNATSRRRRSRLIIR